MPGEDSAFGEGSGCPKYADPVVSFSADVPSGVRSSWSRVRRPVLHASCKRCAHWAATASPRSTALRIMRSKVRWSGESSSAFSAIVNAAWAASSPTRRWPGQPCADTMRRKTFSGDDELGEVLRDARMHTRAVTFSLGGDLTRSTVWAMAHAP